MSITEPQPLFRLYVGNLNTSCTESSLRTIFEDQGIVVGNIVVKRSFAFIDCPDQANADRAIDRLNGQSFAGSEKMQVEPSMARRRYAEDKLQRSNKIQIKNFPSHVGVEEIQELVHTFGPVAKCELVGAEGLVYVTFESPDTAQQAVTRLNGIEFQGSGLKVDFANNRTRRGRPQMPTNTSGMNRTVELPLRIIVGSEFIGAIIGRQGQTIQNITQQSRARVDVHRTEHLSPETVITIKGSPESCTTACNEIMKIVQSEGQSLGKGKGLEDLHGEGDYPLKLLCPNTLCGRIIGKQGSVIKTFIEESGAHIVVSSPTDANNYYVDRIVTITGPLENACKAEAVVSEKMRKCFEQDQQSYNNQMGMYGPYQGGPGGGPMGGPWMRNNQQQYPLYPMGGGMYPQQPYNAPRPPPEVTFLYIPESTVGAVIGTKGTNIKNIKKMSQAEIKIVSQGEKGGETPEDKRGSPHQMEDRKVIITGTAEAQWKAQFYIFEKIKSEGGYAKIEEVHLRSEIMVPKPMIGRIIGKGGQHVKEMQRVSGAIVKTPDTKTMPDVDEVPVAIIGHFYATNAAQRRIRALMLQAIEGAQEEGQSGGGGGGGRRGTPQQNGN